MTVTPLFPTGGEATALRGLYLRLALHRQAAAGEICIYANYISSLDGRIALPIAHDDANERDFAVPTAMANQRDWRLYQELAAQADVMITSARYFRQLAEGRAQDLLPVGREPAYADLRDFRQAAGLKPQPDVVIVSNSLHIPAAALDQLRDRQLIVCCSEQADAAAVHALQARGVQVWRAGAQQVFGQRLKQHLIAAGYRSAYMIAGPQVHRTLLADGVLDELFLTTHLSLLGGDHFHTILADHLPQPVTLQLQHLFLDEGDLNDGGGQIFAHYRYCYGGNAP